MRFTLHAERSRTVVAQKAAADHAVPELGRSCKKGRQKNRRQRVARIGISADTDDCSAQA